MGLLGCKGPPFRLGIVVALKKMEVVECGGCGKDNVLVNW